MFILPQFEVRTLKRWFPINLRTSAAIARNFKLTYLFHNSIAVPSFLSGPAAGPFGATIAHGYLTLSLTVMFMPELIQVKGISMGINYGTNKVRFPAPLLVGSMVRAGAEILEVTEVAGGYQTVMKITIEVEGSDRPVCVVESVSRFMR